MAKICINYTFMVMILAVLVLTSGESRPKVVAQPKSSNNEVDECQGLGNICSLTGPSACCKELVCIDVGLVVGVCSKPLIPKNK
ncbi:hypothetical protein RDABS01_011013 [Bienertia sinuspersici]